MRRDRLVSSLGVLGWVVALGVAVGAWQAKPRCPGVAESPPPVRVVARVGGEELLWEDLEFEVLARQAASGVLYEGLAGQKQLKELQESVLEGLVTRLLLVQEAGRRGHRADPDEVDKERNRLLGQVPQGTELARRLAAGRYRDQLDRFSRWSVVGNKLLAQLREQVRVTPDQVEAYYRRNRDRLFRQPPSVLADELVFPTREKAQRALDLLSSGKSPEEVGRELGVEPRRTLLVQGATDPARTRAVWGLPVGRVSEVVETPEGGFAVLRVAERRPESITPLDRARPFIERVLRSTEERRLLAELVADLKSKTRVERYWPEQAPSPPPPSPGR